MWGVKSRTHYYLLLSSSYIPNEIIAIIHQYTVEEIKNMKMMNPIMVDVLCYVFHWMQLKISGN